MDRVPVIVTTRAACTLSFVLATAALVAAALVSVAVERRGVAAWEETREVPQVVLAIVQCARKRREDRALRHANPLQCGVRAGGLGKHVESTHAHNTGMTWYAGCRVRFGASSTWTQARLSMSARFEKTSSSSSAPTCVVVNARRACCSTNTRPARRPAAS